MEFLFLNMRLFESYDDNYHILGYLLKITRKFGCIQDIDLTQYFQVRVRTYQLIVEKYAVHQPHDNLENHRGEHVHVQSRTSVSQFSKIAFKINFPNTRIKINIYSRKNQKNAQRHYENDQGQEVRYLAESEYLVLPSLQKKIVLEILLL